MGRVEVFESWTSTLSFKHHFAGAQATPEKRFTRLKFGRKLFVLSGTGQAGPGFSELILEAHTLLPSIAYISRLHSSGKLALVEGEKEPADEVGINGEKP